MDTNGLPTLPGLPTLNGANASASSVIAGVPS